MSYTPPCDNFDVLSLFPPSLKGGLCFEEDGELDEGGGGGEDKPPEDKGEREKGMEAGLAALRKRAQEAEAQLAQFKAQQEEVARKAAEEQGEYRKLYEDLKAKHDPLAEQYEALSTREQQRIEALTTANDEALKKLPEGLRHLVPEGLGPEATAKQLQAVQALMAADAGVSVGGINPRSQPKQGEAIPKQYLERANTEAARYDMEPLQYWKVRLKPLLTRQGKLSA